MGRVAFLVDGFNLYHSLDDAARLTGGGTKWLDLRSLCLANLFQIGAGSLASGIYYFSVYAFHLKPEKQSRHEAYVSCLQACGVHCELSRFKHSKLRCFACGSSWARYEEKETDVAIAVKLLEVFQEDLCDEVVLLSGDTDLSPAIRSAKRLFPEKGVLCAFPYLRYSEELEELAHKSFTISPRQYRQHQFPNPFFISPGKMVAKPGNW